MAKKYIATKDQLDLVHDDVVQLQNKKLDVEDKDVISIATFDLIEALFEGENE